MSKTINRAELVENYIERIIDGMDHKSMYEFVYDTLESHFDKYTLNELIEEVSDNNEDLLGDS